jgi:hypothetical protein
MSTMSASRPQPPRPHRAGLVLGVALLATLLTMLWITTTVPAARAMPPLKTGTPGGIIPQQTPSATYTSGLHVSKTGPGSAYPRDAIVYRIDLTNGGPYSTTAIFTDTLPSAVTLLGTSPGQGVTCSTPSGSVVTCQAAAFPVGALRTVTITVAINSNASGSITNYVQASSSQYPTVVYASVTTQILLTPTPSLTPTGSSATPDFAECNNDFDHAYRIAPGQTQSPLNFVPPAANSCGPLPIGQTDVDYFVVHTKYHDWFDAETTIGAGIDTYLRLYDQSGTLIAENDDIGPGNYASEIYWRAAYDGDYYLQVTDVDPAESRSASYTLLVTALAGTPVPTATTVPTAGPTPIGGLDTCEPNYDLYHACSVAPGAPRSLMNFVSADPNAPDNDWYMMWQKPGLDYICETADLTPGMDTNIIAYNQDGVGVGGNDDCTLGDFRSCITWNSSYTGWVYFLVGSVNQPPPDAGTYTFKCSVVAPTATPTPAPTSTRIPITFVFPSDTPIPPPTPVPPTPVPPPTATPPIVIVPLPTPTIAGTPLSVVRVSVQVYYDANNNEQLDAGEGVVGVRTQLVDEIGAVLDSRVTVANGAAALSAPTRGDVYLEVPYFSVRVPITALRSAVQVRVVPQPVPGQIP